jgi:hypothetical protein
LQWLHGLSSSALVSSGTSATVRPVGDAEPRNEAELPAVEVDRRIGAGLHEARWKAGEP